MTLRDMVLPAFLPTLVFEVGIGAVLPIVALSALHLGASAAEAALMLALMGVGQVLGDVPAARLAQPVGDGGPCSSRPRSPRWRSWAAWRLAASSRWGRLSSSSAAPWPCSTLALALLPHGQRSGAAARQGDVDPRRLAPHRRVHRAVRRRRRHRPDRRPGCLRGGGRHVGSHRRRPAARPRRGPGARPGSRAARRARGSARALPAAVPDVGHRDPLGGCRAGGPADGAAAVGRPPGHQRGDHQPRVRRGRGGRDPAVDPAGRVMDIYGRLAIAVPSMVLIGGGGRCACRCPPASCR